MAIIEVVPGVCGLNTRIVTSADEDFLVALEITSDCGHIRVRAD